ncbi:unnamed protein product [Alopecurus aequalis]
MEPTTMAGSSIQGASWGPWSRLPDDLLGMVLAGLDSLFDHVRFAMVCTSWRIAVSTRPQPRAHPWLLLDPHGGTETKRAYCPGDGTILPLALLLGETTRGKRFIGSHPGGWVAYEAPPFGVMNVFSGAEVVLPPIDQRGSVVMRKVIFSESPNSSRCILAAITNKHEVVICCFGSPESGWTTPRFKGKPVMDIAFSKGHLYCIVGNTKELAKLEVGLDKYGVPAIGAVQWPVVKNHWYHYFTSGGDLDAYSSYIVDLRGKLVVATRGPWGPSGRLRRNHGSYFLLFELVDVETDRVYWWENVTSLGDHALFLGPSCCKAMQVSTSGHGGLRRNHIYYSHHRCYTHKKRVPEEAEEFFASSNNKNCHVYYKRDESTDNYVDDFKSVGYYVFGGAHPPMWLFPPHL